jgi:hypothetical protein
MAEGKILTRRSVLKRLTLGAVVAPAAAAFIPRSVATDAASVPPLAVDAPEAKAVKYVENAALAKDRVPDSSCANCGLYQGAAGAAQGPCQLFPGKSVKAAGWCSSWAPQL